jgi:predicted metal-dependent phosphoesterase TrpH
MSLFKTQAIILNYKKIKDKDFVYTIFTKDFWKILVNKKYSQKEKNLDIWYIINCEIETKENRDIHKIRNIKIKYEFLNQKRSFAEINKYLEILNYIYKNIELWITNQEIYNILEYLNSQKEINEIKLLLTKLKLININWELNIENKDNTINKILKFINLNNIKTILKLNWITKEIKNKLEKI